MGFPVACPVMDGQRASNGSVHQLGGRVYCLNSGNMDFCMVKGDIF